MCTHMGPQQEVHRQSYTAGPSSVIHSHEQSEVRVTYITLLHHVLIYIPTLHQLIWCRYFSCSLTQMVLVDMVQFLTGYGHLESATPSQTLMTHQYLCIYTNPYTYTPFISVQCPIDQTKTP